MRINYDFWYVKRDDDGFITEASINMYEGDYFVKNKTDIETLQPKQVTEYTRTRKLTKSEMSQAKKFKKDDWNGDACVYDQTDFGQIKTDEELMSFCESQTKKDKTRQIIDEQDSTKNI